MTSYCQLNQPERGIVAKYTFEGIYPMLYAFFDESGKLDRSAMTRQVEACIAGGSHGLAIGGLATECNKLSTIEKRQLSEWVLADTASRVPVSVTITESTLTGQIEMAKAVAGAGAQWVSSSNNDRASRICRTERRCRFGLAPDICTSPFKARFSTAR